MEKFCVFGCQFPEEKNRKHVRPQWLTEMTGDPNRTATSSDHRNSGPGRTLPRRHDSTTRRLNPQPNLKRQGNCGFSGFSFAIYSYEEYAAQQEIACLSRKPIA